MNGDVQIIQDYFSGYIDIAKKDDYFFLYRFGQTQRNYYTEEGPFYGKQAHCGAGICISVKSCQRISFDFVCGSASSDHDVVFESVNEQGKMSLFSFPRDGEHAEFEFDHENVVLYFSYFSEIGIRNIQIIGEAPIQKNRVILSYGDSITQGYMTGHPAISYPSVLARAFDAEIYNMGISGYFIRKGILNDIEKYPTPWMITVSYGSNDWNFEKDYMNEVPWVFEKIHKLYPHVPVCILLPIVRVTEKEHKRFGTLEDVRNDLRKEAAKYPNFTVINSGATMRLKEHFDSDGIHPNDSGMHYFGEALVRDISKVIQE